MDTPDPLDPLDAQREPATVWAVELTTEDRVRDFPPTFRRMARDATVAAPVHQIYVYDDRNTAAQAARQAGVGFSEARLIPEGNPADYVETHHVMLESGDLLVFGVA